MGWKNIRDTFGIHNHIVRVAEEGICIGSGYVSNLATIDPTTGVLHENSTFLGFANKYYPELFKASPAELLALIQADDTFTSSIPVFTYVDGAIVEKECEVVGWPNTTHDGEAMFENSFSTDKDVVIGWAKRNAQLRVTYAEESLSRLKEQLAKSESDLDKARASVAQLEREHPGVPVAN